jgi:hypothetical protein
MKSYTGLFVVLMGWISTSTAQQPGGSINSPEALASPGTGPYGAVSMANILLMEMF